MGILWKDRRLVRASVCPRNEYSPFSSRGCHPFWIRCLRERCDEKPSTNFFHEYSNGRRRIRAFVFYSWMVFGCEGQQAACPASPPTLSPAPPTGAGVVGVLVRAVTISCVAFRGLPLCGVRNPRGEELSHRDAPQSALMPGILDRAFRGEL
jgi:hypothetical protein